jgi:hypothetical protein
MDIAALILWILTAGGGFVLLGTWLAKGGARTDETGTATRFPAPVIFGHFLLAATGLVLWIVYVATDTTGSGWAAFVLLLIVALLGFTMFARWVPTYLTTRRGPSDAEPSVYAASAAGTVTTAQTTATSARTAESHFPVPIVLGHGVLAATTLVLVIIALATG